VKLARLILHDDAACEYGRLASTRNTGRRTRETTAFFDRFSDVNGWERACLAEQLAATKVCGSFVAWLITTGRMKPTVDYLVSGRVRLGTFGDLVYPELSISFVFASDQLGYQPLIVRRQWAALIQISVLCGTPPTRLTTALIEQTLQLLQQSAASLGLAIRNLSAAVFGMQAVLFHLGLLDRLSDRSNGRDGRRVAEWERIAARAPTLAATARDYLDQMSVRLRPNSIRTTESALRLFAGYLVDNHPEITAFADVRRAHVQAYKSSLAARPGLRTETLANQTVRGQLGALVAFFARLEELDIADTPPRQPIRRSDLPIKDDPLPRFIDDAASAKLLVAARAHPDLFARTAIEMLARTGMRKSELLGLTIDAVVQIGSSYWLRVPIGKLHNDRYIPLHPQIKMLLDEWLTHRGRTVRSNLLFVERGRRITASRIDTALHAIANDAGIGHVSPHQLRHTLATQAINRGMSLEAIAALLGHKSLSMTLVYARIADRTVADEYFAVTKKVEALYDQPRQLPADAEGTEMAKLRREANRRMLGNGYCARPVELDCHFESICEACTYFVTTVEFRPTLKRQRDDAANKGQIGRQKIFDGLLDRLDETAS
jgi:site-specific recombinase XerD